MLYELNANRQIRKTVIYTGLFPAVSISWVIFYKPAYVGCFHSPPWGTRVAAESKPTPQMH